MGMSHNISITSAHQLNIKYIELLRFTDGIGYILKNGGLMLPHVINNILAADIDAPYI